MRHSTILVALLLSPLALAAPDPDWTLDRLDVRPAAGVGFPPDLGGFEREVYGVFHGLPWTRYDLEVSDDGEFWVPFGPATEAHPGHYVFAHPGLNNQRFFRADVLLPDPEKTYDAWFTAGAMDISAALHRFARAYGFETSLGVENLGLELGQAIDELSDQLEGQIIVVDPATPFGLWRVAWGGQEVMAPDPASRDQAVADFQAAVVQAGIDLTAAQDELAALDQFPPEIEIAVIALEQERLAALGDRNVIRQLPLSPAPQYIAWQAPLSLHNLEALKIRIAALNDEKTALQDAITRNQTEAQRLRTQAELPVQVFAIAGTWYVRWSLIEQTFSTQAQAEAYRDGFILPLIAMRLQEADDLDDKVGEQQTRLQQICDERDALDAMLPAAQAEADTKETELGTTPATKPDDGFDPRINYKSWVAFDSLYLDWMWIELFRELQVRKDAYRALMEGLGMSSAEIAEEMADWDNEQKCRRKVMHVYCDEPIKLELQFINQFSPFTIDTANATWEVEYKVRATNSPETEQLGGGGELCLTPEQVKEIWQKAKDKEEFEGISVVLDFTVRFNKLHASGIVEACSQDVQVIIDNEPRALAESRGNAVRTATPSGIR